MKTQPGINLEPRTALPPPHRYSAEYGNGHAAARGHYGGGAAEPAYLPAAPPSHLPQAPPPQYEPYPPADEAQDQVYEQQAPPYQQTSFPQPPSSYHSEEAALDSR